MKKVFGTVALCLALGLAFSSYAQAGHGRGAMDGTGPTSINSGCPGPFSTNSTTPSMRHYQGGNKFGSSRKGQVNK